MLALHLPNKLILPDALHFAQEAIASPDVHVRAAACTVIVDVAEGCSDALRKKLLPVLQVSLLPSCMAGTQSSMSSEGANEKAWKQCTYVAAPLATSLAQPTHLTQMA